MKNVNAKLIVVLTILLLLVVAGLFVCIYHTTLTAYANDFPNFSISTEDGQHWHLYYEGVLMQDATGNFFNYEDETDPTQPAVLFRDLIRARLTTLGRGEDEYNLSFTMPTPTITFKDGMDSNPYTELNDSEIFVDVNYSGILSSAAITLEYKVQGADASTYQVFPSLGGNSIRFGQSVDKGDYEVRVKTGENFIYLERAYNPISTSAPLVCHITDAEVPDRLINPPALDDLQYGMTLADIAARASELDRYGTWTVAEGQNPDFRFSASENMRTVYMDFESINQNYNVRKNLAVSVRVAKRTLSVYVESVDALKGQPIKTNIGYSVDSALAPGDTLESIGFAIDTSEVDITREGEYSIYVTVTNPNYNPITRTYETQHVLHSFYRVHPNKVYAESDDFREFIVERPDGFIGLTVKFYRVGTNVVDETSDKLDGMTVIVGYVVLVQDESDALVNDLGEITITMQKRPDDYAIAYELDGEMHVIVLDESMTFTLPNNVIGFAVLKKDAESFANTLEWNGTLTALCVLIVLFAVASWVVVCIYIAKRRLLND